VKETGGKPIIKKIKKVQGGGAHGGSWKVAYADFVTAMMAFFLLMWLINMSSPEKKAQLSYYFKNFSIFDKGGWSLIATGKGTLPDMEGTMERLKEIPTLDSEARPPTAAEIAQGKAREKLKEALSEDIKKKLEQYKDQVRVIVQKNDVRIEIMDKEGKPIFPLGSPELNPNGKSILKVLNERLKTLPNKIAIEGHTDAISFAPTKKMTNWELSTERANAARRDLYEDGLEQDRLAMVTGYAATKPLITEDPSDPRNRRICIVIMGADNETAADTTPVTTTIPEGVPDVFPDDISKHLTAPVTDHPPGSLVPDNEAKQQ